MRKSTFFYLYFVLFTASSFTQSNKVGMVYEQNSKNKNCLYVLKEFFTEDQLYKEISYKYFNEHDEVAIFETATIQDETLVNYVTAIHELDFSGSVTKVHDKMTMVRVRSGKTIIKNLKWQENIIVAPMLPAFIKKNISKLIAGETVAFVIPYFDLLTMIPLVLERKKGDISDNNGHMIVEMKLKSVFLRLFVEPVFMVIDIETAQVTELHGPTTLPEPGRASRYDLIKADIFFVDAQ